MTGTALSEENAEELEALASELCRDYIAQHGEILQSQFVRGTGKGIGQPCPVQIQGHFISVADSAQFLHLGQGIQSA